MTGAARPADTPVAAAVMLTLACLFWSGVFVIGRGTHETVPPVALTFLRFFLAAAVLMPLAWRPLRTQWRMALAAWRWFLVLGLMAIALFPVLLLLALARTTAINGSLINSTQPVMTVALSYLVHREAISARQGLGIAASLTGVLVIVAQGDASRLGSLTLNGGDLMILLALFLWTVYSVVLRRMPAELHPSVVALGITVAGVPFVVPFLALEIAGGRVPTIDATSVLTLLYFGIFPSALALLFWNRGVVAIGPNRSGVFVHSIPVFGTILAVVFLDETPRPYHGFGMALVVLGIWLATARNRRAAGHS